MRYYVKLESRPDGVRPDKIQTVKDMDKIHFPGCEVSRLDNSYVWIAWTETGQPAGYASLYKLTGESYGYLSRAAVMREHRRRGLHKRLIQVRINLAKKLGWKGLITYTSTDNVASLNSLVNHGFRLYIPEYRWAGKEFLYLMRTFPNG